MSLMDDCPSVKRFIPPLAEHMHKGQAGASNDAKIMREMLKPVSGCQGEWASSVEVESKSDI